MVPFMVPFMVPRGAALGVTAPVPGPHVVAEVSVDLFGTSRGLYRSMGGPYHRTMTQRVQVPKI